MQKQIDNKVLKSLEVEDLFWIPGETQQTTIQTKKVVRRQSNQRRKSSHTSPHKKVKTGINAIDNIKNDKKIGTKGT